MSEGEKIHVRYATLDDLEPILEVDGASFSRPWSSISFQSLIEAEHTIFLVAELRRGEEVVIAGHGILIHTDEEADLTTLAVAPDFRRRGIGGELLDNLLGAAQESGVRAIFLEVRPSNQAAIALYLDRGFRQVGVRRQYYDRPQEDALVLRLRIPPMVSDSATQLDEGV